MEPQVNYDQRYSGLLTVYRLRSFAAAAVELSLTASAVSKQIRSLESDLGRPLFRSAAAAGLFQPEPAKR